jgi:hypothetical protein
MWDWLFGQRDSLNLTVLHPKERMRRRGPFVWSVDDAGHIYLFGERPGAGGTVDFDKHRLQTAVWKHQSQTGHGVTDLVVTSAVAHDLIACRELVIASFFERCDIIEVEGKYRMVFLDFFDSGSNLVVVQGASKLLDFNVLDLSELEDSAEKVKAPVGFYAPVL